MAESLLESFDADVGIDSDEDKKHGQSNRAEWFKGDKGRTYRTALVYFHPADVVAAAAARATAKKANTTLGQEELEKIGKEALVKVASSLTPPKSVDELTQIEKLDLAQVKFKKFVAHYKEGVGYVLSRLGLDGAENDTHWKSLGDPKNYFSTVVLFYPCDKDGNLPRVNGELDKARLMNDWYVMPWRFGPKVYESIWAVNKGLRENDLTIANQDLILKCENAEFQNFKITAGGKATWRRSPELGKKVLEKAASLYAQLIPFREMSSMDLKIKLGVQVAQGEEVSPQNDFGDLLDRSI